MNNNQTPAGNIGKHPSVLLDPAREKDADDLVHEAHEPNDKEDIGIKKGKDPDDLIHDQPEIIKPGSLPDPETIPIDDDIDDEMRR